MRFKELIMSLGEEKDLLYKYTLDLAELSNLETDEKLTYSECELVHNRVKLVALEYHKQKITSENLSLVVLAMGKLLEKKIFSSKWKYMEKLEGYIIILVSVVNKSNCPDKNANVISRTVLGFGKFEFFCGLDGKLPDQSLYELMQLAQQLEKFDKSRELSSGLYGVGLLGLSHRIKNFRGYPTNATINLFIKFSQLERSLRDTSNALLGGARLVDNSCILFLEDNFHKCVVKICEPIFPIEHLNENSDLHLCLIIHSFGCFAKVTDKLEYIIYHFNTVVKLLPYLKVDCLEPKLMLMIIGSLGEIANSGTRTEPENNRKLEWEACISPCKNYITTVISEVLKRLFEIEKDFNKDALSVITLGIANIMDSGMIDRISHYHSNSIMKFIFAFKNAKHSKLKLSRNNSTFLLGFGRFLCLEFTKRSLCQKEAEIIISLLRDLIRLHANAQDLSTALLGAALIYLSSGTKFLQPAILNPLIEKYNSLPGYSKNEIDYRCFRIALAFFQSKLYKYHNLITFNPYKNDNKLKKVGPKPIYSRGIHTSLKLPNGYKKVIEKYFKGWSVDILIITPEGSYIFIDIHGPKHRYALKDNYKAFTIEIGYGHPFYSFIVDNSNAGNVIRTINNALITGEWPESEGQKILRMQLDPLYSNSAVLNAKSGMWDKNQSGAFSSPCILQKSNKSDTTWQTKSYPTIHEKLIKINPPGLKKILGAYPYKINLVKSRTGEVEFEMLLKGYIKFLFDDKKISAHLIRQEVHFLLNSLTDYITIWERLYTYANRCNCSSKEEYKPEVILVKDFKKHIKSKMKKYN